MFNEALITTLFSPKAHAKLNDLPKINGKMSAATGSYDPRATQNLQKLCATLSSTFSEVLKISTDLCAKLTESAIAEEKAQQAPTKGEARAAQQPTNAQTRLAANRATTSASNAAPLQHAAQSRDSQRTPAGNKNEVLTQVYVQESITHDETSTTLLSEQEDAQLTFASAKNGADDSANQERRSKTYRTVAELKESLEVQSNALMSLLSQSDSLLPLNAAANQKEEFSSFSSASSNSYAPLANNESASNGNRLSFDNTPSYSVNSSSSNSFAEKNPVGWLMHLFEETRALGSQILILLGQSAERNNSELKRTIKAATDIKAALQDIKNSDDWQFAEVDENGKPIPDPSHGGKPGVKIKEKYQEAFQIMYEQGIKIDGLDIYDWLKQRSDEIVPPPDTSKGFWEKTENWWNNKVDRTNEWFDKKYEEDSKKSSWLAGLGVFNRYNPFSMSYLTHLADADGADPEKKGKPGYITKGDLLKLSETVQNATVERQDANSKLQGQITYQNEVYQAFQHALINTGLVIAELMKAAFVKLAI